MSTKPVGVRSSAHPLDRSAAARDLWPGGTLDFWLGHRAEGPDRVYWPENAAEVALALADAKREDLAVVPYGAGSGVCGGARGRPGSVVIDTKRLDRIGPLDASAWTVTCEAGVNGQHLEDWLRERGWTLGHSPSSIWCSTVGGWAAARSAGQFSSRYGVFEDMVLGLKGVLPDGRPFHIGEGGDDPDGWMDMMLGSEGTLGVVTEVTLRVWPRAESRWLRGYAFPDVESALRAMRELMQGELWPFALRLYDPVDTRIGGKTKPKGKGGADAWYKQWLKAVSELPVVKRRSLVLPLSLPGLVNSVFDRMASGCFVVLGFEGDAAVVEAASAAGHAICCEEGTDLGEAPGKRWYDSRHAVSYKLMPIFERGGFADTMEVAMRWSDLPRTYAMVRDAVRPHAVIMAHMSHLYPEGGSIYFSFAGQGNKAAYEATWKAALQAVLDSGATTTHHHGVGSLKAATASAEIGPAIAGWRALKAELDPEGRMNPGRLFVDVDPADPKEPPDLDANDGLDRIRAEADLPTEAMFPWEQLPAPPRWQRDPWQTGWTEVSGVVNGRLAVLGRGPRSAAGPDLRPWLAEHGSDVQVTVAVAPDGPRWMGVARPERPWHVAQELLRSDLRPAVLTVDDGELRVGFRGHAAAALGAIASGRVPGGLSESAYAPVPLAAGALERCGIDDPGVVRVTLTGAWRRA